MGKPISPLMRQRLTQLNANLNGGQIIQMKTFTEGRFRGMPLPDNDPTPGVKYVGLYSQALKKGTTSPSAFGKPCPVVDKLAELKQGKTKEEKEQIGTLANISIEYWMPVIHRQDPGDANNPKLKILPCKRTPFKQITEYMLADESGDDICDADEGRDFLYKKTGSGTNSEYSIPKFYDSEPISKDPVYQANVLKAYAAMDVQARFWPVDWDILDQMYQMLSDGESIPDHYKEQFDGPTTAAGGGGDEDDGVAEAVSNVKAPASHKAPPKAPVKAPVVAKAATAKAPIEQEAETSDTASWEVGVSVSFDVGGVTNTGKITSIGEPDAEGDLAFEVCSDDDGGMYELWASIVQYLAPPETDGPVEETTEEAPPEEVAPTKAPVKTATAKPKAPPPVAAKPKAPPAKAPAPPVKPGNVPKAPAKAPVPPKKPGAASGAIAGKLASMKK